MAKTTVAEQLAKTLEEAGVKRIWGVTGDSLNGLSDALRRMNSIQWLHVRHEEVAAFAAGADGLPVKVIVYDNASLGFVAMEMKASGYLDTATDLRNPNFAAMANAMGVLGLRVEQSEDVEPALRKAFAHDGPVLVDVVTARQELVMPPAIKLEQAKGLSLYMLKAIINGRGDEVIELVKTNLRR